MTVVPLHHRSSASRAQRPVISIRELAARTGTTLRALRHYEDIGLLTAGRRSSGARCYDADQRERAALIARLRRLGMPTPDIHTALSDTGGDDGVARFLADEIAAATARIADLRAAQTELEAEGLEGLGAGSSPASVATVDRSARLRHAR